ncbi:MAG: MOSC domain-containing protein [Parvibaculum sp.]|nr:MOSC domain-containing protein [Parvibaculum sp.]
MTAKIKGLYRYPVKGLSPDPLKQVRVNTGQTIPYDRAFAFENGTQDFNADAPKHFPKIKFLMLMRDERLARLTSRFDEATTTLTISEDGIELARGDLMNEAGRAALEAFMASYMSKELRGAPRLVHAPGFSHSDAPYKLLSIINLATIREVEKLTGKPIDPLRFRGNIYVDGIEPWEDHSWLGKSIRIGDATLKGFHKIPRCAATNVNLETATRDMDIPKTLMRVYDHVDLGLYVEVTDGGMVSDGDTITLV